MTYTCVQEVSSVLGQTTPLAVSMQRGMLVEVVRVRSEVAAQYRYCVASRLAICRFGYVSLNHRYG